VETSERFVEGLASSEQLEAAFREAMLAKEESVSRGDWGVAWLLWFAQQTCVATLTVPGLVASAQARERWQRDLWDEQPAVQSSLLRDLFGPLPFRPLPSLDPAIRTWNNGTLVGLAEAVYQERSMPSGAFDQARLAILADALEDAGAEAGLVKHLRGPGHHVRGCFVIDLLLAKK
jgi:hypothetical protein